MDKSAAHICVTFNTATGNRARDVVVSDPLTRRKFEGCMSKTIPDLYENDLAPDLRRSVFGYAANMWLTNAFVRRVRWFLAKWRARLAIRDLMAVDGRLLRDIGLERTEIESAVRGRWFDHERGAV